jgi:hypothetical protein
LCGFAVQPQSCLMICMLNLNKHYLIQFYMVRSLWLISIPIFLSSVNVVNSTKFSQSLCLQVFGALLPRLQPWSSQCGPNIDKIERHRENFPSLLPSFLPQQQTTFVQAARFLSIPRHIIFFPYFLHQEICNRKSTKNPKLKNLQQKKKKKKNPKSKICNKKVPRNLISLGWSSSLSKC